MGKNNLEEGIMDLRFDQVNMGPIHKNLTYPFFIIILFCLYSIRVQIYPWIHA